MKKILSMAIGCIVALTLMPCAYGNGYANGESKNGTLHEPRVLVAYFSRTGNTKTFAGYIQELTGGDLFEIVTVTPYSDNYDDCRAQAVEELAADARPALATHVADMATYDVIFVGFPIWMADAPMAIRSFLEEYDFSGKEIIPFCTHGSGGFGGSIASIEALCPNSTVRNGLAIQGANVAEARDTVEEWLAGLNVGVSAGEEIIADMPKLTITVGETELTATLLDSPTSRDFLTLLPLTLTLEDYNGTEKISSLPRALTTENAAEGYSPSAGDICLYGLWGNLCVFYKGFSYSSGLVLLGYLDSGIETIAGMTEDFAVTMSLCENESLR